MRRIEWDAAAGEVLVHDHLEGRGTHRVESRLVLSPERGPVEIELLGEGALSRERAWQSERMGERIETEAAVALTKAKLPATFGFRLRCLE